MRLPDFLSLAGLELNFARSLNIDIGTIYRKMPYLKLLAFLKVLDLEEEHRQAEDRKRDRENRMADFSKKFRGNS